MTTATARSGAQLPGSDGASGGRSDAVLDITDLSVTFPKRYGGVRVLERVSLHINAGECVAVVGESGCGKSLLGLAAAGLLPDTAEVQGSVSFQGRETGRMRKAERRALHGASIAVVYQDAMTSLNPGMTIGAQLRQVCRLGSQTTPQELLFDVGLTDISRILRAKPYQLSGGQRQRVLIAIALAREPELIIADEPTTALDVTVQAQVVKLLQDLQERRQFALMFISHDLALVSELAARTVVMYAGQVVESGPTDDILSAPRHPYTTGLLSASVSLEQRHDTLASIPGHIMPPADFPTGCRFRDRCFNAQDDCAERPPLDFDRPGHQLACLHPMAERKTKEETTWSSR